MLESAVTSLMLSRVYRNQSYNREVKTKVWGQTCPKTVFWVRIALPLFVTFVGFAPHNAFELKNNLTMSSKQASKQLLVMLSKWKLPFDEWIIKIQRDDGD